MTNFELSFTFFAEDHTQLNNDIIFKLRHELVAMLENCGFGDIEQNGEHFANTYAIPATDNYYEQDSELYISYVWWYPLVEGHGNYSELVSTGIHQLKQHIRERFHIYSIVRIAFI